MDALLLASIVVSLIVEVFTLFLALFNISRERHSFSNIVRFQLGLPLKNYVDSVNLVQNSPVKASSVSKELSKEGSKTGLDSSRKGASSSPKESSMNPSTKELAAQRSHPDAFPIKISPAAIGTAYRNRATVIACFIGIIGALDPLGKIGIIGFDVYISIVGIQVTFGYAVLHQWAFNWIIFLENLNKQNLQKISILPWIRTSFTILFVLNYVTTFLIVFFFIYDMHNPALTISWFSMQVTWLIAPVMFIIICTISTFRAIEFLEEGKFAKQNHANITNLKRKMVCANLAFLGAIFLTVIAMAMEVPINVGLRGKEPPLWYFFLIMVIVPQCWCFVLGFNWIWKIEVVDGSTPATKQKALPSVSGGSPEEHV